MAGAYDAEFELCQRLNLILRKPGSFFQGMECGVLRGRGRLHKNETFELNAVLVLASKVSLTSAATKLPRASVSMLEIGRFP